MLRIIKLFILVLPFISLKSYASIDCRLWNAGFPDLGNERVEFSCTKILTTNINVDFYVSDLISVTTGLNQMKEDMKEALVKSYNAFSALGPMPKIKAVMYHNPYFDDTDGLTTYASAITDFAASHEACPVIIYPAGMTFNRTHIKQLIAHELFHCYQWKNFRAKTRLGTQHDIGLWWLEGTAQFMSNYVYPNANMEYSSMFDAYNSLTPLTAQSGYGNVHFFQSLYNQSGENPQSIIDFMIGMPSSNTEDQVNALGNISNISNTFHDFAKSMSIPNLQDSSGNDAPILSAGPAGIITIENLGGIFEKDFTIKPYTVHNLILPLTKGYRYKISMTGDENVKYSIRHYDEEVFVDLPVEKTLGCEFSESYEIVITASGNDLNNKSAKLKIESEEYEKCPCENTTVDQCMVGNWQLDPSSMENFVRDVIGEQANVTSVTGFENMSIDRTGLAKVQMSWLGIGNGDMAGTPTEVEMSLSGNYDVELYKKETNLVCSNMIRRDVVGNMKVTANGYTFNLPLGAGTPYDEDTRDRLTYSCNRRELIISTQIPPGDSGRPTPIDVNWRYLRR